ncbi:MAG: metalloregulator ArsR/SmtB family transcription factor [Thermoplasmata archaeon]|nr:metalloregulator ArsR/SmtB family transcription factor [Thermoplasmata archaeon]
MTDRPGAEPSTSDLRGFELEADLIRVLANPKRLMIVSLLGPGPLTVTEIAHRLNLSLQNTSQHLRLMRDRTIVRAQRDGREVRYALTSPVFSEACRLVRQALLAEARARPAHFGWGGGSVPDAGALAEAEPPRNRRTIAVPS